MSKDWGNLGFNWAIDSAVNNLVQDPILKMVSPVGVSFGFAAFIVPNPWDQIISWS